MIDVLQFELVHWQWVTGGCVPRIDKPLVLLVAKGVIDGTYTGGGVWRDENGKQVKTPVGWRYRTCDPAT
jgi:hypothetical protein